MCVNTYWIRLIWTVSSWVGTGSVHLSISDPLRSSLFASALVDLSWLGGKCSPRYLQSPHSRAISYTHRKHGQASRIKKNAIQIEVEMHQILHEMRINAFLLVRPCPC